MAKTALTKKQIKELEPELTRAYDTQNNSDEPYLVLAQIRVPSEANGLKAPELSCMTLTGNNCIDAHTTFLSHIEREEKKNAL